MKRVNDREDERMLRLRCLLFLLLAGLRSLPALAQPASGKLETVNYAELGKIVRANKGKVVVVFFWAQF
jgi:hypothetical protein